MRNPLRLKNLSWRLAPWYVAGLVLLLLSRPTPASVALGCVPVVLGLALRAWAVGHLVKTQQLTVTGPYAHLRHPLYLGTLLVALGFASMLRGWPSLVALGVAGAWFFGRYLPRKETVESARLSARHGEVYDRYRAAVPALWPRRVAWRPCAADAEKLETDRRWRLERFDRNNELGPPLASALGVLIVALRSGAA